MSDIFEEVDEAVLKDKAQERWKRFSPFVYGLVAVVIIGVGAREFLQSQSTNAQENAANEFALGFEALQTGDYSGAINKLDAIVSNDQPFKPLAAHVLAEARISGEGDTAAASAALKSAGENPNFILDEMALLKASYIDSSSMTVEALEAQLSPILSNPASQLKPFGDELIAARMFELGDVEGAKQKYDALRFSLSAPQGVRSRAEEASAVIESLQQTTGQTQ